jgi:hypothetical protein
MPVMAEIRTRETQHGGKSVTISKHGKNPTIKPPSTPEPVQKRRPVPPITTSQQKETVTEKAKHVTRVANRLGWVETENPEEAMHILSEEAEKMNENVYKYLESLAKLGRTVCLIETPSCGKCPMQTGCNYAKSHTEKKKIGLFSRK